MPFRRCCIAGQRFSPGSSTVGAKWAEQSTAAPADESGRTRRLRGTPEKCRHTEARPGRHQIGPPGTEHHAPVPGCCKNSECQLASQLDRPNAIGKKKTSFKGQSTVSASLVTQLFEEEQGSVAGSS